MTEPFPRGPSPHPPPHPPPHPTDEHGEDAYVNFDASIKFLKLQGDLDLPAQIKIRWIEHKRSSMVCLPASHVTLLGSQPFGNMGGWHYTVPVYLWAKAELLKISKNKLESTKGGGVDEEDVFSADRLKLLLKLAEICNRGNITAAERELDEKESIKFQTSNRYFNHLTYKAVSLEGEKVKAVDRKGNEKIGVLCFSGGWEDFSVGEAQLSFAAWDVAACLATISLASSLKE